MSTVAGRAAEEVAAEFLRAEGFTILAQNWRTRWCEIDIVARGKSGICFVEVKYRAKNNWGSGFDYITQSKQRQMNFAADFWCAKHNWLGDYTLSAVELTGDPPKVTNWLSEL